MMSYVQSIDYDFWEVIEFDSYVPTKVIKVDEKSYQIISKPRKKYCEEEKKIVFQCYSQKYTLFCFR